LNPVKGFKLSAAIGVFWNRHWPENIIVILADGPSEPGHTPPPYVTSKGTRYCAFVKFGYAFGFIGVFMDLGLDVRGMEVKTIAGGITHWKYHYFVGPHFGLSVDFFF
jgi:hypothetical protein